MVAMATSALPRLVLSVFWPAVPTTVAASTATDCGANSTFHSTSRVPSTFFSWRIPDERTRQRRRALGQGEAVKPVDVGGSALALAVHNDVGPQDVFAGARVGDPSPDREGARLRKARHGPKQHEGHGEQGLKNRGQLWTVDHGVLRRRKSTPRTFGPVSKKRKNNPLVHWIWALTILSVLGGGTGCGLGASQGSEHKDKQVFRYNESAAITSLDPASARSLEHMWVVDQLYDGLVELNADLEVVPCVAKSWEIDPVTHTYTFHLRPGVSFSTGRPVDASDVVFSLERLRDPSVVSSGGWILDAVVPDGIRAVDDTTVAIQLSQAYPPFLGLLTTAYGAVVDREHAQADGVSLRNQPGGTGPFVLKWWLEDAGLVLHPNPDIGSGTKRAIHCPTSTRCTSTWSRTWGRSSSA